MVATTTVEKERNSEMVAMTMVDEERDDDHTHSKKGA